MLMCLCTVLCRHQTADTVAAEPTNEDDLGELLHLGCKQHTATNMVVCQDQR
jgi:hypothetical protein